MAVDVLGLVGTTHEQIRFDACVDAGGFGLIYRGRHLGLDEEVALKCLKLPAKLTPELCESVEARFRDETKILYRLSRGNLDIVRCIGGGVLTTPATGALTPYMILEWLDGRTLGAELKERAATGAPPRSLGEAITLLDSAAGALAYAHAQGVVHRDVKPGNLFLATSRAGEARLKVLDFGLAKIFADEALGMRPSVQTAAGVHFCSPSYGAPEQFSPKLGPIGPWTDVYALVLVVYELLLGRKVRRATSLAEGLLKAIDPTTGSPSPSSLGLRVPPAVEAVLVRAIAQNPRDRHEDVAAFWSALRAAMSSSTAGSTSPMRPRSQPPLAGTLLMANAPSRSARPPLPAPVSPGPQVPSLPPARAFASAPAPAPSRAPAPSLAPAPSRAPAPRRPRLALLAVLMLALALAGAAAGYWYFLVGVRGT